MQQPDWTLGKLLMELNSAGWAVAGSSNLSGRDKLGSHTVFLMRGKPSLPRENEDRGGNGERRRDRPARPPGIRHSQARTERVETRVGEWMDRSREHREDGAQEGRERTRVCNFELKATITQS